MRQPAQATSSEDSASRCAQKDKHTRQVQAASKRPGLSRMVIGRHNFKIDQRGKKGKSKVRRFKSQARLHAVQACGGRGRRIWRMARTGLLKEGQRGRGRFAATFALTTATDAATQQQRGCRLATSALAPCTLRRSLLQ
jgi:hypothetical protein